MSLPQKQYKAIRTDKLTSTAIHDTDLELDILATLAFTPKLQYKIISLSEEDFYHINTKDIYNKFIKMYNSDNVIDISLLNKNSNDFVLKLINRNNTTLASQINARIKKLKDISGKRKIQGIAHEMTTMVSSGKDLKDIRNCGSEIIKIGEDILKDVTNEDVDEKLEEFMTREKDPAIKTGFPKLDRVTGGFMAGTLNIIASAQGIGKTTAVINMLSYICGKLNKKALFVPLEMSFMSLHAKIISCLSGVSFSKMMYGGNKLSSEEWAVINNARAKASQFQIYRLGEKETTTNDIRGKIKALGDVDIVIIDYMQLVKPVEKSYSMYEKITNISRELKIIASETNIPFIVVASINRDYSDRNDNRPKISDIRGSGNIEYDADMVLLLHRESAFRDYDMNKDDDEYIFKHSADVVIAKNRFGESNLKIDLFFDGEKSLLKEASDERENTTRPDKIRADTGA